MLKDGSFLKVDPEFRSVVKYAQEREGNNREQHKKHRRTCLDGTGTEDKTSSDYTGQFCCKLDPIIPENPPEDFDASKVTKYKLTCYDSSNPESEYAGYVHGRDDGGMYSLPVKKYTVDLGSEEEKNFILYVVQGGVEQVDNQPYYRLLSASDFVSQPTVEQVTVIAHCSIKNDKEKDKVVATLTQEYKGVGAIESLADDLYFGGGKCGISVYRENVFEDEEPISDITEIGTNTIYCGNGGVGSKLSDMGAFTVIFDGDVEHPVEVYGTSCAIPETSCTLYCYLVVVWGGDEEKTEPEVELVITDEVPVETNIAFTRLSKRYGAYKIFTLASITINKENNVYNVYQYAKSDMYGRLNLKTDIPDVPSYNENFTCSFKYTVEMITGSDNKRMSVKITGTGVHCYGGVIYHDAGPSYLTEGKDFELRRGAIVVYLTRSSNNTSNEDAFAYTSGICFYDELENNTRTWYQNVAYINYDENENKYTLSIYDVSGRVQARWF